MRACLFQVGSLFALTLRVALAQEPLPSVNQLRERETDLQNRAETLRNRGQDIEAEQQRLSEQRDGLRGYIDGLEEEIAYLKSADPGMAVEIFARQAFGRTGKSAAIAEDPDWILYNVSDVRWMAIASISKGARAEFKGNPALIVQWKDAYRKLYAFAMMSAFQRVNAGEIRLGSMSECLKPQQYGCARFMLSCQVVHTDGSLLPVDFNLMKSDHDAPWRIVDVIISQKSFLMGYRQLIFQWLESGGSKLAIEQVAARTEDLRLAMDGR